MLGLQRVGPGEVALLKLNGDQWDLVAEDIFAVIQGKISDQVYNEVFLK